MNRAAAVCMTDSSNDEEHDRALLEDDFRDRYGVLPDAAERAALREQLAADDLAGDAGMHPNDRATCHSDRDWADHAHDSWSGARIDDTTQEPLPFQWPDAAHYFSEVGRFVDHTTAAGPIFAIAEIEAAYYDDTAGR